MTARELRALGGPSAASVPVLHQARQIVGGESFPLDHFEPTGAPCCDALLRVASFRPRDPSSGRFVDRSGWGIGRWHRVRWCPFCGQDLDSDRDQWHWGTTPTRIEGGAPDRDAAIASARAEAGPGSHVYVWDQAAIGALPPRNHPALARWCCVAGNPEEVPPAADSEPVR